MTAASSHPHPRSRAAAFGAACLFVLLETFLLPVAGRSQERGSSVVVTFRNASTRLVMLSPKALGRPPRSGGEIAPGDARAFHSLSGLNGTMVLSNNLILAQNQATTHGRQAFQITQSGGAALPQDQVAAPPVPNRAMPSGSKGSVPSSRPKTPVPVAPTPANGEKRAASVGVATGSKVARQDAQAMLDYHNRVRAEVGNAPVRWSSQIARFAQQRADDIARTRRFEHLPQGRNPYGENLAQGAFSGQTAAYTVIDACEGWHGEKAKMPRNARVMTVDLFNRGVGHYTQMVWKGSTEIGAGIAQYQDRGTTFVVVVCCYSPAGNLMNAPIF